MAKRKRKTGPGLKKRKRKAGPALKKKTIASTASDTALVKFDLLQRYLAEISNYNLLTREQERELGIRVYEYGDKEAAYELVTSNLRLVVKIALEFQRIWMQNLLDLIQEGNIGLMQAVKKFNPYKLPGAHMDRQPRNPDPGRYSLPDDQPLALKIY